MGEKLSAGQKQRIGIARALYNEPSILILDEATSNLDYETESNIIDNIFDLNFKKNKTYLIISHRRETLKKCNKILKIEKGYLINENS